MKKTISITIVLTAIILAGCNTPPQVGTYHGEIGKLGTTTLTIRSDGTIFESYGPFRREGTWVVVTNMIIRAQIQGLEKHASTRFYALDKATGSYRWAYDIDQLMRIGEHNHQLEGPGDLLRSPADSL